MLMERIIGAFTFKKEVYADVEQDTSFTPTAWVIVAVVAFFQQLGTIGNYEDMGAGLVAVGITFLFAVGGFALGAFVISAVGKALYNAETDFEEMVRVLGLAYVWNIVGAIGIVGAISPVLICVVSPVLFVAWIMGIISWFVATQEALDLETVETIITVVVGWVAVAIVSAIGAFTLGILGISAAALLN